MNAYKCDVCGKLYDRYTVNGDKGTNILVQSIKFVNSRRIDKTERDLCKECCNSFNTWFDSRRGINECEEEG